LDLVLDVGNEERIVLVRKIVLGMKKMLGKKKEEKGEGNKKNDYFVFHELKFN